MGLCASNLMNAEDREHEKTATFVRYATSSDLLNLRKMIKNKMDPNARDRFGMSALHWAAYTGRVECVQELLKAGALPSATDANGRNALHHACRKDHDEIVRYLVTTVKMDINARSENKDTPLHKAVRGKSVKVVEMLLKLGADANLRNDQNRTPMEELEAALVTDEIDVANRVEFAGLSAHPDPKQDNTANKPLGSATFTLDMNVSTQRRTSVEHTEIRRFGSRRSPGDQYSNQTTEQQERGQWVSAVVAPTLESSSSLPVSSPVTLYMSPPVSPAMGAARRKNLRYAGKRVIMALRVKKALPDEEKIHMIRLLMLKYTATAVPALFIAPAGH